MKIKWNLGNDVSDDKPFRAIVQSFDYKKDLFETVLIGTDDGYYIYGEEPAELNYSYNIIMWTEYISE